MKVKLYMISTCTDNNLEEFSKQTCTVVTNMREAREFMVNKSVINHYEHYIRWAEIHELNADDYATKLEYVNTVLRDLDDKKDKYGIRKFVFDASGVASIMRMFNGCIPVGCSYETNAERVYFNELLKESGNKQV